MACFSCAVRRAPRAISRASVFRCPTSRSGVSIAIHLLGGLAVLVGYKTRWAAAVLLLLCLGTAFGVHLPAGDTENMINFYKNLVMAGGFLYVINFGAGAISFDEGATAR
jgi:uncharacterized membrane protein YphA (DoxX/SURF4 family)